MILGDLFSAYMLLLFPPAGIQGFSQEGPDTNIYKWKRGIVGYRGQQNPSPQGGFSDFSQWKRALVQNIQDINHTVHCLSFSLDPGL